MTTLKKFGSCVIKILIRYAVSSRVEHHPLSGLVSSGGAVGIELIDETQVYSAGEVAQHSFEGDMVRRARIVHEPACLGGGQAQVGSCPIAEVDEGGRYGPVVQLLVAVGGWLGLRRAVTLRQRGARDHWRVSGRAICHASVLAVAC